MTCKDGRLLRCGLSQCENHAASSNCIFSTSFARIFSSTSKGLHHRNDDFVKFFIVCWPNQCTVVVFLFMIYQLPFFVKFFVALITLIHFTNIVLITLFMLLADIFVTCRVRDKVPNIAVNSLAIVTSGFVFFFKMCP